MTVPVPIPTIDGGLFAGGLVAETLREIHRVTQGWPQRPGWRSSSDLPHAETGKRLDLTTMPAEAVSRCREAWERLAGHQTCVVHGNPNNPGNIRVFGNNVALIDWDEAHVDAADLYLALPENAAALYEGAYDIAAQTSAAWEAAVRWRDDYAVKRLPKFEKPDRSRVLWIATANFRTHAPFHIAEWLPQRAAEPLAQSVSSPDLHRPSSTRSFWRASGVAHRRVEQRFGRHDNHRYSSLQQISCSILQLP